MKKRGRPTSTRRRVPWTRLSALALLVVVGGLSLVFALGRTGSVDEGPLVGRLQPEHVYHEFGQVPMDGGVLQASFPLEVTDQALVMNVGTT